MEHINKYFNFLKFKLYYNCVQIDRLNTILIFSPRQSFRGEKRKQERKKKKEKEIYQNVKYKSKLRLVTIVFDVASNGNSIPSIHTSLVEEKKRKTS